MARPNDAEREFLTLAYSCFYDIFEEMMSDSFWEKDDWYRLSKMKSAFGIYSELLNYPPIPAVIEHIKRSRPPMEAEIASGLLRLVRNIIVHMPFFDKWDEVWINKNIVNWYKEGQSIDRYLRKYEGHEPVKYRFWEHDKKRMTYISINYPNNYSKGESVLLKNMLTEKDGVKFSLILMKKVLDTQVEK